MFKNVKFSASLILLVLVSLALAILLGKALLNYAHQASLAVSFRYPIDYGEGPLLDQTLRLAQGENLYHNDFSQPPYTISNYPPVFLLAQVPFAKIFGAAFWYGRGISVLSALVTALMIGLTLYTLTGEWLGAVFGGLLLLAFPYIQFWSLLNRIDALALGLSWIGIFVLVRWNERKWGIPLAALFLILSIYTRQSYALAAPAGAFIWLLAMRKYRKALELALEVGGVSLVLFGLINLLTRGGFFLNIVTANVNPFNWHTVDNYFKELRENTLIFLIFIALYLVAERFTPHTRTWPLALPYLVGAVLSAITVGKDGSNVNYLFELAAALSFATGAALAWVSRNRWVQVVAMAALLLQMTPFNAWALTFNGRVTEKTDNAAEIARLYDVVRQTDGIVLADEYMGLLPLAGKRIYYQPFEFKMLSDGGLWDQEPFLNQIVKHQFAAILLYDPPNWSSFEARWTKFERPTIESSYQMNDRIANTQVLLPK